MQWYYSENLKPQGPNSTEVIKNKIQKGEIGPNDLLLQNDGDWMPAGTYREFSQSLFPAWQEWDLIEGDVLIGEKKWVLLLKNSHSPIQQEGPFTTQEVYKRFESNPFQLRYAWIWKNGLSGWARLVDRPEFNSLTSKDL
jgi:hypothetical protein